MKYIGTPHSNVYSDLEFQKVTEISIHAVYKAPNIGTSMEITKSLNILGLLSSSTIF